MVDAVFFLKRVVLEFKHIDRQNERNFDFVSSAACEYSSHIKTAQFSVFVFVYKTVTRYSFMHLDQENL